jgi:hypothetical protein
MFYPKPIQWYHFDLFCPDGTFNVPYKLNYKNNF